MSEERPNEVMFEGDTKRPYGFQSTLAPTGRRRGKGSIWLGLGIWILCIAGGTLIAAPILGLDFSGGNHDAIGWALILFNPGLCQLPLVVVASILLAIKRQTRTLKALVIPAGMLLLINGLCFMSLG